MNDYADYETCLPRWLLARFEIQVVQYQRNGHLEIIQKTKTTEAKFSISFKHNVLFPFKMAKNQADISHRRTGKYIFCKALRFQGD
jgi:hypothetical protein